MAANIENNLANWSVTDSSNQPDGSDPGDVDADLRRLQAVVRKYMRNIGSNIASASTTNLANATGDVVTVTGTTAITSLGNISSGMRFWLVFADALTLTHSSSLILPGADNITTAAGDVACFESLGSGNWRCFSYQRASGLPIIEADGEASVVTSNLYRFTATGGETEITIPWSYYLNRNTLAVYINGLKQYSSTHYTEDDATHITFLSALTAGDVVEIIGNVSTSAYIPTDPALAAISALTPAADKFAYFTSSTAAALADLTSFARTVLATSDAAAFRTAIGAADSSTVSGIGVGQTWQDVKASRAGNVSYQNTTGKPIMCSITVTAQNASLQVSTDNSTWVTSAYSVSTDDRGPMSVIIPDDHYYKIVSTGEINTWAELR